MKVTIVGDAVVFTSTLKLEDIKKVGKYRPEALTVKGGENGKDDLFTLVVSERCAGINEFSASFSKATKDGGFATYTELVSCKGDDPKEYVADKYGAALRYMNMLESSLPGVIEQIDEEKAKIMEGITVQ